MHEFKDAISRSRQSNKQKKIVQLNDLKYRKRARSISGLLGKLCMISLLLTACSTNQGKPQTTTSSSTLLSDATQTTTTSSTSKQYDTPLFDIYPEPGENAIFDLSTYPRIDGSTVTIPISEAITAKMLDIPIESARMMVLHNKTHDAYVNLIDGRADVIFVTYASEEELAYAKKKHVELEFIPIVKDAFVFFVNKDNPVSNLTQEQIRGIYSGKCRNWQEVGGPDREIVAYQRPVNSGSQSGMLDLVMKDTPLMDAPKESRIGSMEAIIDAVAAYSNSDRSIGYSYYYFVNSMYYKEVIKLLSVDGVEVENGNIESGAYPYQTYYYAVLNKSAKNNKNARKFVSYILSDEGQEIVESLGYVQLGK